MTVDELLNVDIKAGYTLQEFISMYVKEEFSIRDILNVKDYQDVHWTSLSALEQRDVIEKIKQDLRNAGVASI